MKYLLRIINQSQRSMLIFLDFFVTDLHKTYIYLYGSIHPHENQSAVAVGEKQVIVNREMGKTIRCIANNNQCLQCAANTNGLALLFQYFWTEL